MRTFDPYERRKELGGLPAALFLLGELAARRSYLGALSLGADSELCLAKTLVIALPTGIHPCGNVTKPLRILLILRSAGLLANETRGAGQLRRRPGHAPGDKATRAGNRLIVLSPPS
jgi:hypothetical protein